MFIFSELDTNIYKQNLRYKYPDYGKFLYPFFEVDFFLIINFYTYKETQYIFYEFFHSQSPIYNSNL